MLFCLLLSCCIMFLLNMISFLIKYKIFLIALILTIMPFFWMKLGEMDMGGDGGRLYFYDPVNLIKHTVSYVFPYATGRVEASFYSLPFFALLALLKQIIPSGYILISLFNGIKIAGGFLAIYAITKELLVKEKIQGGYRRLVEIASIVAGVFYIFSHSIRDNYVLALPTQDQVLLNPLMFYLILRYLTTSNFRFMWIAVFISFIFSHSFSYGSAPPFFAFYPLAILFLLLYTSFIRHIKISWGGLLKAVLLFIGLHAFHLIPEVFDLFTPGSHINSRVFDTSEVANLIGYFYGVLSIPKVSYYLLSYAVSNQLHFASLVIPSIVILGFITNYKREKTILLLGIFFLITLFLISAKITNVGIELYKLFFHIPGFGMFRNFYGQWQFVFYFFYSLLFGQALFIVLSNIRRKIFIIVLPFLLVTYLIISSWNFINGNVVNQMSSLSSGVKFPIIMDPQYENVLQFFRSTPEDAKILSFPFSDNYFQLVHGINNGAYIGRSFIGQLTGRKDFSGYTDVAPYSEVFIQSAQKKDYIRLKEILGLLNIRYIFHNSDPRIYDNTFLGAPYSYVRKFFPINQQDYEEFIKPLVKEKVFESGPYKIYTVNEATYLPHFYVPKETVLYENDPKINVGFAGASSFVFEEMIHDPRAVFIEKKSCTNESMLKKICKEMVFNTIPQIFFKKISPVKYKVKVANAKESFVLVFSEAFHGNWKLFLAKNEFPAKPVVHSYFNNDIKEGQHTNVSLDKNILETLKLKSIPESQHFGVNAYANAWLIKPEDTGNKTEYELIVEMTGQRILYVTAIISLVSFIGFLMWGFFLFLQTGASFYKRLVPVDKS